jgi:hypothetical protein
LVQFDSAFPVDPEVDAAERQREATLEWTASLLLSALQQASGISAVSAFTPLILESAIPDPFLASLLFAGGLTFGALVGTFGLGHVVKPLVTFIGGGFVSSLSALMMGLALYPGAASAGAATPLAIAGLIIFAISFGAGPSALFWAALGSTFRLPEVAEAGFAINGCWANILQSILRLVFPVFVARVSSDVRVGRGVAFLGFAGLGVACATASTLTLCLRRYKPQVSSSFASP